jgi:hypothetical protein
VDYLVTGKIFLERQLRPTNLRRNFVNAVFDNIGPEVLRIAKALGPLIEDYIFEPISFNAYLS